MHQRFLGRCLIALASFVPALGADAQTSNATLQGTVTDSGGGVLPGVSVKLQSPATGLQREAVTNSSGVFVFNFLPAGTYEVTAELAGFKTVRHDAVQLEIGQNRSLDMKMEVGRLEETVTVEGTAPLLDRTSGSIGTGNSVDAAEGAAIGRAALGWPDAARTRGHQHRRRHAPQHPLRRAGTR